MTGAEHWTALSPEIALVGGALLLLLLDAARPHRRGVFFAVVTMLVLGMAAYLSVLQWFAEPAVALGRMVVLDRFGSFVRLVVLGSAALATLAAPAYLKARALDRGEFYALLLLSTSGMTLLAVSSDLVMVFLAIELLSLGLYVMSGLDRARPESQEAAMKYFLLGAFASAFLLYGIALVFGASGTTNLIRLREALGTAGIEDFQLLAMAVALLAVGLGFKASMVPFHMWTPDVYQGAPTPVTAFMAGGTKAAAFGALLRVFVSTMTELRWDWRPPVIALSLVTFVVASVLAISQTDVKRMLAYSSVAHAGFIGIAVVAASRTGVAAALLYLFVYTAMTVGAFGCVMLFRDGAGERVHLAKYSGLGTRHPVAAALFAFFLFSLAGIPPTGGFIAKFYVFFGAIRAGYAWLAIAAVLASVASAFFYIRVAVVMFMQPPPDGDDMPLERSKGLRTALAVCAAVVLAVGVYPAPFLELVQRAVRFA